MSITTRLCEHCDESIPETRRRSARFCGEKCRRKAEHLRGWNGGWIKKYHEKNKEKLLAYNKEWQAENPDKVKATRWRNRDKKIAYNKEWKLRNPERTKELRRLSRARHLEKEQKRASDWAKAHPKSMRQHKNQWKKRNPGKVRADARMRQTRQQNATPKWLTIKQIKEITSIYEEAAMITKESGVQHEVDHIIPLRGKIVCGLHVPWNLQILTYEENRKKRNKLLECYMEAHV